MEEQTFPVLDTPPKNGRQLVTNDPTIIGTMTGRQLASQHSQRRKLTFAGALMTTGSFTMMAATGGIRRKLEEAATNEVARRQLSFSGALMTSGSFTMMAATGVQ